MGEEGCRRKYICWHQKLAKADSGQAGRLDRVQGRSDRVSCSRSGTKGPGGLTAPRGRSNWVTPISGRIRSLAWFRVVTCYLQGKTSHTINIKGRGRLRPIIQSSLSSFILFSPNPGFSNLLCSPPSSLRRLREFWVACRSQDNPRRTVPDGVPPGAANLGFRRFSCPRRLDRPPGG
jgi:hypothetical protein